MDVTQTERVVDKSRAVRRAGGSLMPIDLSAEAGNSPVIARGKGAVVTDVDGNEYVDLTGGGGVLGHADERITAAISKTASKGYLVGDMTETQVRLAELVASCFPAVDVVRFVDSPVQALLESAFLARTHTGRTRIITVGAGLPDYLRRIVDYESDAPQPGSFAYGDAAAVRKLLNECGGEVAAVLVEPLATHSGLMTPPDEFLPALRTLCDAHGAMLVFDETATAFCTGPGATPTAGGVLPDLTVLSCNVAGGLPLAAYGGKKSGPIGATGSGVSSQLGARSQNVLAMAAGVAALQSVGELGFFTELVAKAACLEEGLRSVAADYPIRIERAGSLLAFEYSDTAGGTGPPDRFHGSMLNRGVLLPGLAKAPWRISAAHTDEQIDRVVEAVQECLKRTGKSETE